MKKLFFGTTQALLLATSVGKLIGAAKWGVDDTLRDPLLFFLSARHVVALGGLAELLVVFYIWRVRSDVQRSLGILWLAGLFVVYRAGLSAMGFTGYCKCLGEWSSWIGLPERQLEVVALMVLGFMLVGSISILVHHGLVCVRRSTPLGL